MAELSPTIKSLLINGCLIILALTFAASILIMVGGSKLFEKAKKNKTSAYFPLINLFILLEIVDMSSFFGILFFIPVLNLLSMGLMFYKLGGVFNTSFKFKMGLVFLPICFYPLLAFGDNRYKVTEEDYFKALDDARRESINLLTNEEIKEMNNEVVEESKEKIDSVFKSDAMLQEKVGPYKANKIDVLEDPNDLESAEVENPFKPIGVAKQLEVVKAQEEKEEETPVKFVGEIEKKEKVEYVDL